MKLVSRMEVQSVALASLGIDNQLDDLTADEAIAASIRRAAGFHCPCAPRVLVNAVLTPLRVLLPPDTNLEAIQDRVEVVLDAMVSYGDLLEAPEIVDSDTFSGPHVLYAAPPRFLLRQGGSVFLWGIVPDHRSPLPSGLESRIKQNGHVRSLAPVDGEDLGKVLTNLGLIQCSIETWIRSPAAESSSEYQKRTFRKLMPQQSVIENLMLLDSEKPTHYYRGRWEPTRRQTGLYVARRPQRYGADLWCVVELERGQVRRFLDLPEKGSPFRGCDEAWLLQMAIDAENESPQLFRTSLHSENEFLLELFSPVPQWAQRRFDLLGRKVDKRGALITYIMPDACYDEEVEFLEQRLWLKPRSATEPRRIS